jgi:polysaccharide biosynthesis/export protein
MKRPPFLPKTGMTMSFKIALATLTALALAGCASKTPPLQSTSTLSVVEDGALPSPTRGDQATKGRPYLVGPFDKLKIDVFGIKEMSDRQVQVDASGRISFPLAGSFEVAGLTPPEVEEQLEQRLQRNYIRNPQVTVNLMETVSQVITVDGQVKRPGLYPVLGRLTLMQAVATAEGTSEFAKLQDVVVFRNADGKRYAALYNLAAIRRGYYDDPEMYAGDVVVVGESNARRMFRDIVATAPLLLAPVVAVLQNGGL